MFMVQIDDPRRHVYVKFRDDQRRQKILTSTNRHGEFRRTKGEILNLQMEAAGLGMRRLRIANLSPEVPDSAIRMILGRYRKAKEVQEEN